MARLHASRGCAILLALASSLAAQQPSPTQADSPGSLLPARVSASLHKAWLTEILDLDLAASTKAYERIAANPEQPDLERQLATARLIELQRLGAGRDRVLPNLDVLPEILQPHVLQLIEQQDLPPILVQELEAGGGGPEEARQFFRRTRTPQLRPLFGPVLQAAIEQRAPMLQPRRRLSRVLDRIYAKEVLAAELGSDVARGRALRKEHFGTWQPQPWPATRPWDREAVVANLEKWIQQQQLLPEEHALLLRLQAVLEQPGPEGASKARELLDRLPLYAEEFRSTRRGR
jgi:hypothetical protein